MTDLVDNSTLPWPAIFNYLEELEACSSVEQFNRVVITGLENLVPFDVEAGFFEVLGQPIHVVGCSPARLKVATEYYMLRMPFLPEMEGALPPPHLRGAQVTEWNGRYRDTEFVTDFMFPGGIRKSLTCTLPDDDRVVALHRSRLASAFTGGECAILTVVAPHVRNLAVIFDKLRLQTEQQPPKEAIEEAFPMLSSREADISALLCRRLTAAEISTHLFISRRTVESHIAHVFSKLDVRTRTEAIEKILSMTSRP